MLAVSRPRAERAEAAFAGPPPTRPTARPCAGVRGLEVVYYLVHSLGSARLRASATASRPRPSPREAERAGLRQIVYLGGSATTRPTSRASAEPRRDGEALASGSVPVTTLRAAMVVGRGSAAFETIVALVDRLRAMVCPRWVATPTQPIALADVAAYLAGVRGREETFGRGFDAGGPDVMTYREMIERVARIRGKPR